MSSYSPLSPDPYYRSSRGQYEATAKDIAAKYGIPTQLFLNLITVESNWNTYAHSSAGAQGLTQLMPGTIKGLGATTQRVKNSPTLQMSLGARYLKQQYDRFKDWRLAVAAYNAGPGAVKRYGGVPPYAETRAYVDKVTAGVNLDFVKQPESLKGSSTPLGSYGLMGVLYILVAGLIILSGYFVFKNDINLAKNNINSVKSIANIIKQ